MCALLSCIQIVILGYFNWTLFPCGLAVLFFAYGCFEHRYFTSLPIHADETHQWKWNGSFKLWERRSCGRRHGYGACDFRRRCCKLPVPFCRKFELFSIALKFQWLPTDQRFLVRFVPFALLSSNGRIAVATALYLHTAFSYVPNLQDIANEITLTQYKWFHYWREHPKLRNKNATRGAKNISGDFNIKTNSSLLLLDHFSICVYHSKQTEH